MFNRGNLMKTTLCFAGAALLLSMGLPVQAQVVFFNSQAAFQLASTSTLQATFEAINHEGGISDPYTEGSVTFFDPRTCTTRGPAGRPPSTISTRR